MSLFGTPHTLSFPNLHPCVFLTVAPCQEVGGEIILGAIAHVLKNVTRDFFVFHFFRQSLMPAQVTTNTSSSPQFTHTTLLQPMSTPHHTSRLSFLLWFNNFSFLLCICRLLRWLLEAARRLQKVPRARPHARAHLQTHFDVFENTCAAFVTIVLAQTRTQTPSEAAAAHVQAPCRARTHARKRTRHAPHASTHAQKHHQTPTHTCVRVGPRKGPREGPSPSLGWGSTPHQRCAQDCQGAKIGHMFTHSHAHQMHSKQHKHTSCCRFSLILCFWGHFRRRNRCWSASFSALWHAHVSVAACRSPVGHA